MWMLFGIIFIGVLASMEVIVGSKPAREKIIWINGLPCGYVFDGFHANIKVGSVCVYNNLF